MKIDTRQMMRKSVALALLLAATYGGQALAQDDTVIYGSVVSSMNWAQVADRVSTRSAQRLPLDSHP